MFSLVAQIADNLKSVAVGKGVQFLDLRDMLESREVCSKTTQQVGSSGPSATTAEWAAHRSSRNTPGQSYTR